MNILRNFVVLEGGDGSGTTTQLKKLEALKSCKTARPAIHTTFEPTNGPIGSLIRRNLKGEIVLDSRTIAFLFAADRNEHLFNKGGIIEKCENGEIVVCDRYVLSSLVYQGITCGDDLPAMLNSGFPLPELIIFFDLDPVIAQERMNSREYKEIYENLEFQVKVLGRYRDLLDKYGCGTNIVKIDASKPIDDVSYAVWSAVEKLPIFKM